MNGKNVHDERDKRYESKYELKKPDIEKNIHSIS